jgi:hypothetical protein
MIRSTKSTCARQTSTLRRVCSSDLVSVSLTILLGMLRDCVRRTQRARRDSPFQESQLLASGLHGPWPLHPLSSAACMGHVCASDWGPVYTTKGKAYSPKHFYIGISIFSCGHALATPHQGATRVEQKPHA